MTDDFAARLQRAAQGDLGRLTLFRTPSKKGWQASAQGTDGDGWSVSVSTDPVEAITNALGRFGDPRAPWLPRPPADPFQRAADMHRRLALVLENLLR